MNLGTSLHWVSTKMKDKICLIEDGIEVSYSDLWKNIEILADAFLKIGIKENDKIAIILPNCKEFIYSFYALARINAISVPLSYYLTTYELKKIFNDCKPGAIITTARLYGNNVSSAVGAEMIVIATDEIPEAKRKIYQFEELFRTGRCGSLPDFSTANSQIATINYTYRGIGEPLGAMLTHGNYHHGAMGYVRLTEVVTAQRVLLVTPISHIFTLVSCVIVPLLRGSTVIVTKRFIPRHIFKIIEEHKVDFIIAVPTVYISLLRNYDKGRFDISSLKYGITGGSYLSPNTYREIKETMGIELLQGYGLTETMPITCNPRLKNRPDSLGVPGHEVKVKVVDENNKDLKPGKRGEILIGGPTVMKGYFNRNGLSKKYLSGGWFWTGDYGYLDKDGYIYFDSLKKEIAKIGGNNVDLKEVKEVLASFPGAKDVRLKVLEDGLWGHRIYAEMEVGSKKEITEKDVKTFCKEKLALYKVPRKILITKVKK